MFDWFVICFAVRKCLFSFLTSTVCSRVGESRCLTRCSSSVGLARTSGTLVTRYHVRSCLQPYRRATGDRLNRRISTLVSAAIVYVGVRIYRLIFVQGRFVGKAAPTLNVERIVRAYDSVHFVWCLSYLTPVVNIESYAFASVFSVRICLRLRILYRRRAQR